MSLLTLSTNLYKLGGHVSGEDIRFGDGKAGNFNPKFSLSAFLGQGGLTLIPQLAGVFSMTPKGEGLRAGNANYSLEFQPTAVLSGFNEYGGLDLIITLAKKPPISRVSFGYDPNKLAPFFQPSLKQEYSLGQDLGGGRHVAVVTDTDVTDDLGKVITHRPQHVVNSIAWYHTTKGGMVTGSDVASRITTGKAIHTYSYVAVDSVGTKSFCPLSLDGGNQWSLNVDPAFLTSAVYPVTLSPVGDTFGYTTKGANSTWIGTSGYNQVFGSTTNWLGAAGTGTSMSIALTDMGGNHHVQMAVYTVSGTTGTLIGNTGSVTTPGGMGSSWLTSDFSSSPTFSAVNYRLFANSDSSFAQVMYDSGSNGHQQVAQTFGTWPASPTFTGLGGSEELSIYATYTPGGGGSTYIPPPNNVYPQILVH